MPNIRDKGTIEAIARVFCGEAKRNKTETLRIMGYKPSYYTGGRSDRAVWGNERVKAAIAKIDRKAAEKQDITREILVAKMFDIVETGTKTEKVRAASLIADMCGYKREAAPNDEKERAILARMSSEDKELAVLAARLRTEDEARKGLKIA